MVWFFFRLTKYSRLSEQEQAARATDYGCRLSPARNWLGAHPLASRGRCKKVSDLVGNPVKSGDTLWVYDIHSLGSNISYIQENLSLCHEHGILLRIYTLGYDDGNSSHYQLLYTALDELSARTRRAIKPKTKRGRKPRGISYDTLTPQGQEIIRHYLRHDGVYTRESALKAIQGETADGGSVGRDTFYRILQEKRLKRPKKRNRDQSSSTGNIN